MENDLISSDEEDALDLLLQDTFDDDPSDSAFTINDMVLESQSSVGSSQLSSASEDPLANPDMHWKDANVEDTGAPDPRTVAFHPIWGQIVQRTSRFFEAVFSICVATNHYAEMAISRGERLSYASQGSWQPLTEEELYRFLGIILYMSVVKFQSIDRYWSTHALYRNNPVPGIMSRNRFQAILSFLQVTPPADINKAEKLTRIQSLVDHVCEKSKELYQPYREIAVDERMVASKHKFSGIRQFIKDKPVRFGIKLWVVACNMSGYTYNFFVYLGKNNTIFTDKTKGIGFNVTITLCKPLFD
ncbi:piggyBac transposable element-derived protein 4-like [Ostrea edulis]|uniref:piggyBac transposable element-derived protein 4-like n=1 Tax=Ostrea edulis TaxID=37623 RepID=UPI0024AF4F24|nr:piggyBac transposable element-derived protein 4-like [Ostrea edulis]